MKKIKVYNLLLKTTIIENREDQEATDWVQTCVNGQLWGRNVETFIPITSQLPSEVIAMALGQEMHEVVPAVYDFRLIEKTRYQIPNYEWITSAQATEEEKTLLETRPAGRVDSYKVGIWVGDGALTPEEIAVLPTKVENEATYYLKMFWLSSSEATPEQIAEAVEQRTEYTTVEYKRIGFVWKEAAELAEGELELATATETYQASESYEKEPAISEMCYKFAAEYVYFVTDSTAEALLKKKKELNDADRALLNSVIDMMKDANTQSGITTDQAIDFVLDSRIQGCLSIAQANSVKVFRDYIVRTDWTGIFNVAQKDFILAYVNTYLATRPII